MKMGQLASKITFFSQLSINVTLSRMIHLMKIVDDSEANSRYYLRILDDPASISLADAFEALMTLILHNAT